MVPNEQLALPDSLSSPPSERDDTLSFPPPSERHDTLSFPPSGLVASAPMTELSKAAVIGVSAPPAHEALAGEVVADRYVLETCIGHGSMGVVWRARDRQNDVPVAIKLVTPRVGLAAAAATRLCEEANLLMRVKSPHVARMIGTGQTPSGSSYLVTELLEGVTLQQLLELSIEITPREAISWMCQATQGLVDMHDLGLVHNDVKPSNLLLTRDDVRGGTLKLLDFGAARALSDPTPMSQTEEVLGNPWYMAPERITADIGADHRADIWSVGVILYELLTRRRPFEGQTVQQVCTQVLLRIPLPLREFNSAPSPALEQVVNRCLRRQPEDRYPTARLLLLDLQKELDALHPKQSSRSSAISDLDAGTVPARPDRADDGTDPTPRTRTVIAYAIATTLLIIVGGVLVRQLRQPATTPSPVHELTAVEPPAADPGPQPQSSPGQNLQLKSPTQVQQQALPSATPQPLRWPRKRSARRVRTPAPPAGEPGIPVGEIYVNQQGDIVDDQGHPINGTTALPSAVASAGANGWTDEPAPPPVPSEPQ